jgi:phosphatidylglycerophosphate synthase
MPTGYTRVILAGLSLHFMSYHPKYCTLAYCISCLLDAVDGRVARALGQTSKFGAVLDMVTDRCAPSFLASAALTAVRKMYDIMSALLSLLRIPKLRTCLSIPHRARFLEPLHAHVQVGITHPWLVVVRLTHFP